jgi:predicted O-linked N-acetylglucosamine transferase (SPINDLY family)
MQAAEFEQVFQSALAHHRAGALAEAVAAYRKAIALRPNHVECLVNLAQALLVLRCLDDSIAASCQAVALAPFIPEAHFNLGNALMLKGQTPQAIEAYRQAIRHRPSFSEAYSNLGNVLLSMGQIAQAIEACQTATRLNPNAAEGWHNYGNALQAAGRLPEAEASFRRGISLQPRWPDGYVNLGSVLLELQQIDQAIKAFQQALTLGPGHLRALRNLGTALTEQGTVRQAIAAYRQAKDQDPLAHDGMLYAMHFDATASVVEISRAHLEWGRQYTRADPPPPLHRNSGQPDRRLKIGYVSGDFREHSVAYFLLQLLENHSATEVEVFAYSNSLRCDAMTQRLKRYVSHWHQIWGLSDPLAAELIREHQIDVLVDLSGHTDHHRLPLFALRPAPVQVTWLGYPNTTGLTSIDYRMTDALADPFGQTEESYSEQLFRLSPTAWCFATPEAVDITPLSARPITFATFNSFAKVTDAMLTLWLELLTALPDARLVLKARGLDSPTVRNRVQQRLAEAAVDPSRVDLLRRVPDVRSHLALYNKVDIALDTFPYHGTTTTCEALWMGVPVITLAGQAHVSRVGVSLLTNAGLPELIASTPDQYTRLAIALAVDRPRLDALRSSLRNRLKLSAVMDGPQFARSVEGAFRQMWRKWCAAE